MCSQADQRLTIRKALLFYRDHLLSERENRQRSLARKGKSPASVQDDATEQAFEDELAAIDALLDAQHAETSIAAEDSALDVSSPTTDLIPTTTMTEDDRPYINPFTGLLIVPETANGPGPSNYIRKDATSMQLNIISRPQEPRHQSLDTPGAAEVPKESDSSITSNSYTPASSAESCSPARASSPSTESFSILPSSLDSAQKSVLPSEATPGSKVAGWSVWDSATSAVKSAAIYVFRMETVPHIPDYSQTSTSLSNPPPAGSDFVFPLRQDASGTWKRLPPPPSTSRPSFGPIRSSLSKRLTGPSLASLPNITTPLKKTSSTALKPNAQQDAPIQNPYVTPTTKLPLAHDDHQPGNTNRINRNRPSCDLSQVRDSNSSSRLPLEPPGAVPSTVTVSHSNTSRHAHQDTAKAYVQPLQQQPGKHTALPEFVRRWKDSRTDLAKAISVADKADRKELEAVRRVGEQIVREDQRIERQEVVARQIQAELDREHELFLTAQTADRLQGGQEATAHHEQAEGPMGRGEQKPDSRLLQAEKDEMLRAQEAAARRLQAEEHDQLLSQEALARRLQDQYDREAAEGDAYARRLQEKYDREFERERMALADQEAHARKLQEAWNTGHASPTEGEISRNPSSQQAPVQPPQPPPSPVSTAGTPKPLRAFRTPFPRKRRDWPGPHVWRPPTPPQGTSQNDRNSCYGAIPIPRPPSSPAPPLPTAKSPATNAPPSQATASTTANASQPKPQLLRPPQPPCTACLAPQSPNSLTTLPCRHPYCSPCLSAALRSSLSQNPPRPFTCCASSGPLAPALAATHLPPHLASTYALTHTQSLDPAPLFCSTRRCGTYLPPASRRGSAATCPSCAKVTCTLCRAPSHAGVCSADVGGRKLMALAESKGWRVCGRCGSVVERSDGCLHMTCRCRWQFCYACGREWKRGRGGCRGGCPRG